jgi:transcriptional regulator of heat shock response
MVKTVDHTERKNRVLAAAVSAYINAGVPVSSQELAEYFELCPATLRSILAELEDDGYLIQPHTSSGRVPTDKGYRYYVDFLMSEHGLNDEQKSLIINGYRAPVSSLEDVLEKTTVMIAELTHYTAIVSFSEWDDRIFYKGLSHIFEHPEFRDLDKLAILVRFLEEKKRVLELLNRQLSQPFKVYIGTEIACQDINDVCSLVISPYHSGKKRGGRIAVLGPRRMSYDSTVSTLEFISGTLNSVLEEF